MTMTHVGDSPRRVGGGARVSGRQRYVADIHLPEELYLKLVTVPVAHARIVAIDTRDARAVPGVRLVMTAAELPQPVPRFGPQFKDRPVIATEETKFHGEPVAAVAADTKDAAEEGARRVRVTYEELPAVVSVATALDPSSPLVQAPLLRPDDPLNGSNVLREHRLHWGEIDAATADVVVDNVYSFPMVTHFAIEPHAMVAAPDGDGIAVWSSIQHPYVLQRTLAQILGMPLAKVRVNAPDPGGGFGGKQNPIFEPLVAFVAIHARRPVRLTLTLEETFQAVRRSAAEIRVRTGVTRNGRILFQDIEANYLIGAYADVADRVVEKATHIASGPYRTPAARILGRTILSHTTPSRAMRGIGTPQLNWAVESNLSEAAVALDMDQLEIRLLNLARKGERFIPGETPCDGQWEQAVRRAAQLIGWEKPRSAGRGRGIAVGIKFGPTTGLSYSTVRLLSDGSAIVQAGTSDMGQGARTVFAQIVAHELGAPLDAVTVVMGDTTAVPYDQQTSASRSTAFMGNAVLSACRAIQRKVRSLAGPLYGLDEGAITVDQGTVRLPDRTVTIREVLEAGLGQQGGELIGVGEFRKDADPDHALGGAAAFFEFNCTAVEVTVDEETGDIAIPLYVTVSDVGRSINPLQVRMQDEGAAIQGLGHTLMEQFIFDEHGGIRNLGAIDYRIPTSMDLPHRMVSDAIENADGPGPYGSKGMSEGALLCVAAAVGSAVRDATGVPIRDLPLTPERVWSVIRSARAHGRSPQAVIYESRESAGLQTEVLT